jgi:acid phosphatase (class A)
MKRTSRLLSAVAATLAIAGGIYWWLQRDHLTYLDGVTTDYVAMFEAPPARDSPATRAELEELMGLENTRSDADVAAARADRKTDIQRFYGALGFPAGTEPDLPLVRALAENVEDDTRLYVRAAKEKFRRLRPYEIESRLHPCIDDVRGDLSYPSGHASYGYMMAFLLRELVPERGDALMARADDFARQRMVCGVHFRSDIEAGRRGAQWLIFALDANPEFNADVDAAKAELRAALHLPTIANEPAGAQAAPSP